MVDCWAVPASLVPLQTIPVYISHFDWNMYKDTAFHEKGRHIPLSLWLDKWRGRFYNIYICRDLFAINCSARDLSVKKSKIRYDESGSGSFAARAFGERDVLGFYCRLLIYADLTKKVAQNKRRRRSDAGYCREFLKMG